MLKTKTQFDPMKPGEQMLVVTSNLDKKTNANEQLSPMLRTYGIAYAIPKLTHWAQLRGVTNQTDKNADYRFN